MRYDRMFALALAFMALGACNRDDGVTDPAPIPPAALIRFVNTTVDTGVVDFRFVDQLENLPTFLGVKFRGSSGGYQRVAPGTRAVRIFVNSTNPTEAQKRLVDTTITLAADTRYTLLYTGQARGNNDRLVVITDPATFPTPPAGNTMVRVLHGEPAFGNADVYIGKSNTDPIAANVAKVSNVAPLTYSAYVTVPVARAAQSDSLYTFAVTPAGSTTPTYTASPNNPGTNPPAGASYGPQPGVQISGSVLTAVITGAATAGSPAAVAANVATGLRVVILSDKVLNP